MSRSDWIQTHTGKAFYPLEPETRDIDPLDIGHALSNLCRYAGHVREFYSVAQHSVLMSHAVDPEHALWGLLHDASEAYMADIPRPVKNHPTMELYRQAEDRLLIAVADRFGLETHPATIMPLQVAEYDTRIVLDERAAFMGPAPASWGALEGLEPLGISMVSWTPVQASTAWLARYNELTGGH